MAGCGRRAVIVLRCWVLPPTIAVINSVAWETCVLSEMRAESPRLRNQIAVMNFEEELAP